MIYINPLLKYREAHGLSRKQLADALNVSHVSVYRIEHGQQRPSYDLLRRIMELTGGEVTANDFVPASKVLPSGADTAPAS